MAKQKKIFETLKTYLCCTRDIFNFCPFPHRISQIYFVIYKEHKKSNHRALNLVFCYIYRTLGQLLILRATLPKRPSELYFIMLLFKLRRSQRSAIGSILDEKLTSLIMTSYFWTPILEIESLCLTPS